MAGGEQGESGHNINEKMQVSFGAWMCWIGVYSLLVIGKEDQSTYHGVFKGGRWGEIGHESQQWRNSSSVTLKGMRVYPCGSSCTVHGER